MTSYFSRQAAAAAEPITPDAGGTRPGPYDAMGRPIVVDGLLRGAPRTGNPTSVTAQSHGQAVDNVQIVMSELDSGRPATVL